jgi:hypothetical protein
MNPKMRQKEEARRKTSCAHPPLLLVDGTMDGEAACPVTASSFEENGNNIASPLLHYLHNV